MTKENKAPASSSIVAPAKPTKASKPKAVEVDAPSISSEVDGTVVPSDMPGTYLTVDARMDSSPITVMFSAKEAPELKLENIVDSSGNSGARMIKIPLDYLTKTMGFTLLVSYKGKSQGQVAASLVKEVGISFYPASESEDLAPRLLHEENVNNTPTYDMKDHTGNETVLVPVHPLAKAGDKVYCTAVTEQDAIPHVFYTVIYDHVLTAEEAVAGYVLRPQIARGWLARRKRWRTITLQSAWITSGLPAEPPADVPPHLETRLPRNALEVQRRRTAALIVDPGLELEPPHLRQSVAFEDQWWLNPRLTEAGGDVDTPQLDTYAGDRVCFSLSGSGYEPEPLGCVTIANDGAPASVKLSSCAIACFFDTSMKLSYTVQFPNGDEPQQSPSRLVNVSVPEFLHPGIEEATNDDLDLSTFTGAATATVPVWAYAECSNACWMWITGEHEGGDAYRFDILKAAPVTDDWKAQGVEAAIPRRQLQLLADCSRFELHFAVSFCDVSDIAQAYEFPVQTYKIEQEPLALVAPAVSEAVGSNLIAWNGRNGVHVEVNYVGIGPQHSISVCWKKPDGMCWVLDSKPGSTGGTISFALPAEAVIESMGKTVSITYTVNTACKVQTSTPLNLTISLPTRLETPNVLEATPPRTQNAILDLRTFAGNANSLEDPMWFLRAGQKCWLRATGTAKSGHPHSFDVYAARTIIEGEVAVGVANLVLRSELEVLMDSTNLTLTFSVATDGSLTANVVCPERVLSVRTITKIIEDFATLPYGQHPAGTIVQAPTMSITAQSGYVGIHAANPAVPGMTEGNAIALNCAAPTEQQRPIQTVDLFLKQEYMRVRFSFTRNAYYGACYFYDAAGQQLGVRSNLPLNSWVDFTAPDGRQIAKISVVNQQHSYLDSFELYR